jgi:ATP-dependent helicase/nuclease subunit B
VCRELGETVVEEKIPSNYNSLGKKIVSGIFGASKTDKTEKGFEGAYLLSAENPMVEITAVGQVMKSLVMNGVCRYRDITLAVPQVSNYAEYIKSAFDSLSIPYFMDEGKKPLNHPLIQLILSYIDAIRRNLDARSVKEFFKNPLVFGDKTLTDKLENYVVKYNINFSRFLQPFNFEKESADYSALENARKQIATLLSGFSVRGLLSKINAQEKLSALSEKLKEMGEYEESAVNEQIYSAVTGVLDQMDAILGGVKLSLSEYKTVFIGGINALKLSIIPQYNDAVFIGGYKETALAKAEHLFAVGLTAEVPSTREDVALLSDSDLAVLEEIKVLIEPKIKVINHRERECVALALASFNKELYLSYPAFGVDGSKTVKSSILPFIEKITKTKQFPKGSGYLTEKQGIKTFASTCSKFVEGTGFVDFVDASSFYHVVGKEKLDKILTTANKEVADRITYLNKPIVKGEISPTTLEDYFKCPYMAFLSHAVRLKEREEGKVSSLSIGNVVHDVLNGYAKRLDKITDEESSNAVFEENKERVIEKGEYKKFLSDMGTRATVNRVLVECRKYCYDTYESLIHSKLKVKNTEAPFGSAEYCKYPAVDLNDGKVKLKGKIDRVDEGDKYFRVVDYKTGETDSAEKSLYTGVKLQLFLYAASVAKHYGDNKQLAGLYYLPIADKYVKPKEKRKVLYDGFTLADKDSLSAQDDRVLEQGESDVLPVKVKKDGDFKNTMQDDGLKSYVDYALKVSEVAAKHLEEGALVSSPYDKTCEYCAFKGLCDFENAAVRKVEKVNAQTIIDATNVNAQTIIDATKGE